MTETMVVVQTPAPHILNNNGLDLKWDRALRSHALVKAKKTNVNRVVVNSLIAHGEIAAELDYNEQFTAAREVLAEAIVELFDKTPERKDFVLADVAGVIYLSSGGMSAGGGMPTETARLINIFNAFGNGFFFNGL